MVKVYRVSAADEFQDLHCEEYDEYAALRDAGVWAFDGRPVGKKWKPIELYAEHRNLPKPDVWGFMHTLAFEDAAAAKVQICLDQSCEQLKLPFEKRKLIMINVIHVVECLDKKKSEFDPDLPHIIDKYVFREDRMDYSLFKIPQTARRDIYTVEGLASPDEEFKPLVEKHGLKGLHFEELWSSGEEPTAQARPAVPPTSSRKKSKARR